MAYNQSAASSKKFPNSMSSSSVGKSIMSSTLSLFDKSLFIKSLCDTPSGISFIVAPNDTDGNASDSSGPSIRDVEEELCSTQDVVGITKESGLSQGVEEAREGRVPVIFTAGKEMICLEAS